MNIIIVDDDPFVSLSLKTILESSGELEKTDRKQWLYTKRTTPRFC